MCPSVCLSSSPSDRVSASVSMSVVPPFFSNHGKMRLENGVGNEGEVEGEGWPPGRDEIVCGGEGAEELPMERRYKGPVVPSSLPLPLSLELGFCSHASITTK